MPLLPKQIFKNLKTGLISLLVSSTAQPSAITLDIKQYAHLMIQPHQRRVQLGNLWLNMAGQLDFGHPVGQVSVAALTEAAGFYDRLTCGTCIPQLAALLFHVAGQAYAMNHYFPLTSVLKDDEIERFYQMIQTLLHHSGLDVRLMSERRVDITPQLPVEVAYLVAGQLAEIFFYREDILS